MVLIKSNRRCVKRPCQVPPQTSSVCLNLLTVRGKDESTSADPVSHESNLAQTSDGADEEMITEPAVDTGQEEHLRENHDGSVLAMLLAVEYWHSYLQPVEFVIKTDQPSSAYIDDQWTATPWQQKDITNLMDLQFRILYGQAILSWLIQLTQGYGQGKIHQQGNYWVV